MNFSPFKSSTRLTLGEASLKYHKQAIDEASRILYPAFGQMAEPLNEKRITVLIDCKPSKQIMIGLASICQE